MKKAVGGCLAAAVVLLVLCAVGLWFLVLKPAARVADRALDSAREGIAQVADLGRTVARMRELEAGVRVTGPYVPPADGRLTGAQVERFLAVQAAVVAALGSAAAVPDVPAGELVAEAAGALRALARLGDAGLAAKQAQVDALNAQSMSLDEYRWVRERASEVLIAGGVSMAAAGAGAAGSEVLGQAGEAAQQLGEAARQAVDAARRAAAAARDAWQGKPHAASPPQAPADAPASPGAPLPTGDAPLPGSSTDPRLLDFPLVAPHAEAFIRARALAAIGL
jgi:hypothetical protein